MGSFRYIQDNERKLFKDKTLKRELLLTAEKEPILLRLGHPTRLTRAKMLGYRAKQGYIIVRVRVAKGGFRRPRPVHARRPSKTGLYFNLAISKKRTAEVRARKKFKNMDVLGSYFIVENGQYKWFEVIMRDHSLAIK
jgi:large subunit ribosomal protein L15e